jgi:hypothetical protein
VLHRRRDRQDPGAAVSCLQLQYYSDFALPIYLSHLLTAVLVRTFPGENFTLLALLSKTVSSKKKCTYLIGCSKTVEVSTDEDSDAIA